MKRFFYIGILAAFVASCTNDSIEDIIPQKKEAIKHNQSTMLRDSTSIDTGGQGGSTPIKPPTP